MPNYLNQYSGYDGDNDWLNMPIINATNYNITTNTDCTVTIGGEANIKTYGRLISIEGPENNINTEKSTMEQIFCNYDIKINNEKLSYNFDSSRFGIDKITKFIEAEDNKIHIDNLSYDNFLLSLFLVFHFLLTLKKAFAFYHQYQLLK